MLIVRLTYLFFAGAGEGDIFLLVLFVNYLSEATYYFRVCVFFGVIILLNLRDSV